MAQPNAGPSAGLPHTSTTAHGYLHEIGTYACDEEFAALVRPFALGGLEADEPVVFAYDPYKMDLLRHWLPASPKITFVTDAGPYATPAKALASWRRVVEDRLSAGAPRVRIAGNVPHPGYGREYAGWDRYEAAIDEALGDLPVWAPCLYDVRITPRAVLETAVRRHRLLLGLDGSHRANFDYEPGTCLADFLPPPPDDLDPASAVFEVVDPTLAGVRAMVDAASFGVIGTDKRHDLVLASSEVVANAVVHGKPPVTVRLWTGERRVVVSVHDGGDGPLDPLVGLLPACTGAVSGRGLWLANQLDVDVALIATGQGFTVRIVAADSPDPH